MLYSPRLQTSQGLHTHCTQVMVDLSSLHSTPQTASTYLFAIKPYFIQRLNVFYPAFTNVEEREFIMSVLSIFLPLAMDTISTNLSFLSLLHAQALITEVETRYRSK
uniref:Uncharacterized protein n=1 Tax=Arion vulgaris TaxID=1028688 RepID=A0A0B7A0M8_9EUPU